MYIYVGSFSSSLCVKASALLLLHLLPLAFLCCDLLPSFLVEGPPLLFWDQTLSFPALESPPVFWDQTLFPLMRCLLLNLFPLSGCCSCGLFGLPATQVLLVVVCSVGTLLDASRITAPLS